MRRLKTVLLAVALGAALLWIALPETESKSGRPGNGAPAAASVSVAKLPVRSTLRDAGVDPFAPLARSAPPKRAARAAPAPAVSAPPLPFRFVGRVYQDSGTRVYLARGSKVIAVTEDDVLDGEYRVSAVSGTAIAFVHLPTGQRQIMALTLPLQGVVHAPQPPSHDASLVLGRASRSGTEKLQ